MREIRMAAVAMLKAPGPSALALLALLGLQGPEGASNQRISLDGAEIVSVADRIRFPEHPFAMMIDIESYKGEKGYGAFSLAVYSDRAGRALVKWLSPPRDKGRMLLMLEDDLWMFFPNTRRPIRVSPQQRLLGEVSNGDVVRIIFSENYNATIIGTEKFKGKEVVVLDLRARKPGIDYPRVIYRVEKHTLRPVQAEYYALSDRLLKIVSFEEYQEMASTVRPTKLVLTDMIERDRKTIMKLSGMKEQSIPDKFFDRNYLANAR